MRMDFVCVNMVGKEVNVMLLFAKAIAVAMAIVLNLKNAFVEMAGRVQIAIQLVFKIISNISICRILILTVHHSFFCMTE